MNYWNIPGVPHKGWSLDSVIDIREDGRPEWETDYESCMMCGNEKIRFVHIVSHPDMKEDFRVGCVCAERMTGDYVNPKRRERELQNRANRRANWIKKNWKFSKNGNHYLKLDDKVIVIFRDKKTAKYKITIDRTFGKRSFNSLAEAKVAAFNGVEYMKEQDLW